MTGETLRIEGIVQGVGFRPTVWRLARTLGLVGEVFNDGEGVVVRAWGNRESLNQLTALLWQDAPPLARIVKISRSPVANKPRPTSFSITHSELNVTRTSVAPDAAICTDCREDTLDPLGRRYRYPLTNCTNCGPRYSIINTVPYDRVNTSMKSFELCGDCAEEYNSPDDRRFHAQPNACYVCGPEVTFERLDQSAICLESFTQMDPVDAACTALQNGEIVVIKGIGGFHLCCDATNDAAVQRLRDRKNRYAKPFAVMARDIEVIERYAAISDMEKKLLQSAEAPIVLVDEIHCAPQGTQRRFGEAQGMREKDLRAISNAVAPNVNTLGFMLPYTPMHLLMLKRMNRPIVFTSGNLSDEPQVIDNHEVSERLGDIADYVLWHNRDIVNRVDDSVVRVSAGAPRILRRARGYTPAPIPLPIDFEASPEILAMGSEVKNTFCLIKSGAAILSQHIGDLENACTYKVYKEQLNLFADLFQHKPASIVVDAHPEFISSKLGLQFAERDQLQVHQVQHHHAHIAACLAENGVSLSAEPVLGVVLDGLGFGGDESIWGGEFLLADYLHAKRVGTFKPVAMLGGGMSIHEPWRNTYAHLRSEMSWAQIEMNFHELKIVQLFKDKPRETFDAMLRTRTNSPLASSCGRLFDAVAAAMGICPEVSVYEGQAAIELEAIVDELTLHNEDNALAYPFSIPYLENGLPYIEPLAMWQALLGDLILKTPLPVIAARFHKGLARAIVTMIEKLCTREEERWLNTIALSGGVFQNKTLLELVVSQLEYRSYRVLTHAQVPTNDGGISLGQAVIGAAHKIYQTRNIKCA